MAARSPSDASVGPGTPPATDVRLSVPPVDRGWSLPDGTLTLDRPRVMGVLNLTPDSFSDGGELETTEAALARAAELVDRGADLLDVGGESTRPGAAAVPVDEEARRVLPFIREASRRFGVPISVDTRKAEIARRAVTAGAAVINDVSGLRHDEDMPRTVADSGAGLVIMHMRGTPETMSRRTGYGDVVEDVKTELRASLDRARSAGIPDDRIVVDPGIGFAKTPAQSLTLLREIHRFAELGHPVMVGPSRKSFLGAVLDAPPLERLEGTLAACVIAYLGGARIFRVHDVGPVVRVLEVARAVTRARVPSKTDAEVKA